MDGRWLLKMAQWARRPPSWNRVLLGAAVIAAGLALAGIEALWGWPEVLTVNSGGRRLP